MPRKILSIIKAVGGGWFAVLVVTLFAKKSILLPKNFYHLESVPEKQSSILCSPLRARNTASSAAITSPAGPQAATTSLFSALDSGAVANASSTAVRINGTRSGRPLLRLWRILLTEMPHVPG